MKKVHLGLDLGIASVGWSLVDENQNIIATGSHLFSKLSDPSDNKNKKYGEGTRGQIRRTRRMLNRKKQRKIDFLNMIDLYNDNHQLKIKETQKPSSLYNEKYQSIFGFTKDNSSTNFLFNEAKKYDIYKIWRNGLEKEISPKELFLFLYFKLGLRGVFFKSYEFDENKKYTYEDSLLKTLYEDVYFKKNRKYRNQSNADMTYSIYHNWKDIEVVLRNCSYINEEFINDYKEIFFRHRPFSKGPGNFELPNQSKWGIIWDDKSKTKEEMEQVNLWDKKIGVCPISLYKNKGNIEKASKRLNQYFCIAELANIISQLVYVRFGNSVNDAKRLSRKQIMEIINNSLSKNERITRTRIEKFLDGINIYNFPTTKDGKSSNFESMEKVRKYFSKESGFFIFSDTNNIRIEDQYESLSMIDSKRFKFISKYFEKDESKDNKNKTQNRKYKECIIELKESCAGLMNLGFDLNYEQLANFNDIKEADINGTRNYGFDAYYEYLQNFFSANGELESFAVYFKNEIKEGQKLTYRFNDNSKYIPENMYKEQDFISPNTRNTLKEMIRVINKCLRQYVYKNDFKLESIILETTWADGQISESLLSEEKRKDLIKFQNYNEKKREEATKELEKNNIETSEANIKKIILWREQDKKDVYTNKCILIGELISCQIDHIVPENISFNSNWENLVLTLNNSQKGNKLAREHIQNNPDIIQLWNTLYKTGDKEKGVEAQIKSKKLKNLMMERSELSNQNFINSNLTETTYAIRKAKDGLSFFIENFNNNYIDKKTSEYEKISDCDIRTISGYQSQKLREDFFRLPKKDRKISNHHSHDATMIAMFSSFEHVNNFYNEIKKEGPKKFILNNLYKNNNKFISINDLNKIVNNSEELKNRILNSKCLYSFKKVTILPKGFDKLNSKEKWEKIKFIDSKQIFSNQNVDGYVEIDGNKHKVEYIRLNDFTLNKTNNSTNKNMIILFRDIKALLGGITNLKEIRNKLNEYREKGNEFAKKIVTDWKTLYQLYLCVEKHIDDTEIKKEKNERIFDKYINELKDKNLLEGLKENNIEVNKEYADSILKNYIPIINSNNSSFIKVQKIKYIVLKTHSFAKDLNNKKINSKYIFNEDKYKKLSKRTTSYGHEQKMLLIAKYKIKNKEKYEFLKINWLNEIVNEPNVDYEKILYIDPNKWFLIDNEIYKIGSLDIDSSRLYIEPVSNQSDKNIKEHKVRKTFESWSKFGNDKWQEKIFNKIICQNKKII